ncbi:hypothetical protein [Blattabacterium cuenoti]|uniref:hypothetical protein n=1 Tax=Blattabacterium cuenoti TaxID=1653831 RepID=UPI00311E0390
MDLYNSDRKIRTWRIPILLWMIILNFFCKKNYSKSLGIIEQSEKIKYSYARNVILKHLDSFHKKFWKIK